MPFPRSTRVVFQKNPLVEVICQLRFPPILAIAAEPPSAFQERVRRTYPLYQRQGGSEAFPKELAPLLAQIPVQLPGQTVTHQFLTEDRSRSISLTQDFVAVTEQKYRRWEAFRQEIEMAEAAVREIYEPAFYARVGLRYQDLVDRERLGLAGAPWDRLISPQFAGLLGATEVKDRIQSAASEVVIELDEVEGGLVTVRHGLARTDPSGPIAYLIDADFHTQGRCTSEQAFGALDIFHRLSGNLFRWSITPELQRALEPEPVE